MVEGPIVKLSGDPDVDEDERLRQFEGETLLYDVRKGSWLSVALSLDETYAANEHDEDYIAVPAKVLLVAIGIVYSKEELKWYGQDSVLSPHRLNAIAVAAYASEPKFFDPDVDEPFRTCWHCRGRMRRFAAVQVDLDDQDDAFVVRDELDRLNAEQEMFETDGPLAVYNHLFVDDLRDNEYCLGAWTLLHYIVVWSLEPPDEDANSDEVRATKLLLAMAKKRDEATFGASECDAVAGLLQAAELIPAALLTNDLSFTGAKYLMQTAAVMEDPERVPGVLKAGLPRLLKQNDTLSKWVGDGATAFSHLTTLAQLWCPSKPVDFDVLEVIERYLVDNDGRWRDVTPAENIKYLVDSGAGSDAANKTPEGEKGTPVTRESERAATALLAATETWRASGEDVFAFIRVVMQSGHAKSVKWLLEQTTSAGLPKGMVEDDNAMAPERWDQYFLWCVMESEDGGVDVDLEELELDVFTPAFLSKLRTGKLSEIDWDKDLVVPLLTHAANGKAPPVMSPLEVMKDSERFGDAKLYVSRALSAIGLGADAENSYLALMEHVEPNLIRARRTGTLDDGAAAAKKLVEHAFKEAQRRLRAASHCGTTRSASFIGDKMAAMDTYTDYVTNFDNMLRMRRTHHKTFCSLAAAAGQIGESAGKRPIDDVADDDDVAEIDRKKSKLGKKLLMAGAGGGDLKAGEFAFSERGNWIYDRTAISKKVLEDHGDEAANMCPVFAVQKNKAETWCPCNAGRRHINKFRIEGTAAKLAEMGLCRKREGFGGQAAGTRRGSKSRK